jgi:uncharacterized protein YbcI
MGHEAAASLGTTGRALGKISQRLVGLHREFYGRGPTKAKTYLSDDLVVVMMRGGFTQAEATLLAGGRGDSVLQQRADFQEVMADRFREVVEQELGRKVVATMTATHQHPDLLSQIFVLESTELLRD